jgi:type IV secretory pathway protease TraF
MNGRATTLLVTRGAVGLVLSTIGAKPTKRYLWNASGSVPVDLYRLQPTGNLLVTELVAVQPPEPLASILNERGYLPSGVPMLKRVLALPDRPFAETGSPSPSTTSPLAMCASATAAASRYPSGRAAASSPRAKSFS